MKKYIVIALLLVNSSAFPQKKQLVSADSVINIINKSKNVFYALEKINNLRIDYVDCYHNKKVKSYTLEWLDLEAACSHHVADRIKNQFNNKYKLYKVKGWLKNHKLEHLMDTVLKTPILYDMYLDSVLEEAKLIKRKYFFRNGGSVSDAALLFFMKCPFPEAYTIIRQYWDKHANKMQSPYFKVMLTMHDPLAINTYSAYLDSIIKNKSYRELRSAMSFFSSGQTYGSIYTDFKLRFYKHQFFMPVEIFNFGYSDDFECPCNIVLWYNSYPFIDPRENTILSNFYHNNFDITKSGFVWEDNVSSSELIRLSDKIIEYYSEIEEQELKKRKNYEKKEYYWKANIEYKE